MKKMLYITIVALFSTSSLFADSDTPLPNWMKTYGTVLSVASDATYTYIGGQFYYVGYVTGYGAKLTTASDDPNLDFPIVIGEINVVVSDGSGGWYIGGSFINVGSTPRNNIAHINSDGSVDQTWNPDADGIVNTIVVSGSYIYVGGVFTNIGGLARNYIAKLNNTNGNADATWNPNADSYVYALAVSGTDIYAGGEFTSIGGQSRNRIARLNNTNGDADGAWNPDANNYVNTIAIVGSGIYVGGSFTTIGGASRNYFARIDNVLGFASALNLNPNGHIFSIAIDGTDIYIGGSFTEIGGLSRTMVAKVNTTTGVVDATWNPTIELQEVNSIQTIAITADNVYVGGYFENVDSEPIYSLAKLNKTNGDADLTWAPNPNDVVNSIAISGTDMFIGGNFIYAGGEFRHNLARLVNATGKVDPNWDPNPDEGINVITLSGSDVFVGGNFTTIGGQSRNWLAKLNNTNGNADASWNPNPDWGANVIVVSGSDIYVGGNFGSIGGQVRNYAAKLNNTNGNADASWNPNLSGSVYALAISGTDIYLGGDFITINAIETRYYAAKVNNTDGTVDATWNPNANAGGIVRSLEISGTDIYVGGDFTSIGGQARNYLAKLNNTNGNADATWNPNSDASAELVISGNDIYVYGNFASVGGQTRNYLAKLNNSTGAADINWDPNASDPVFDVAVSGAFLFAGGEFEAMGTDFTPGLAAFQLSATTQASEITFTTTTSTSLSISWTNGDGTNRAVFVKESAGVITNPSDNTTYTASTDWDSKGTPLGASGYYCVYNGTGNSVTVTNLTKNTAYYVQVFEYVGSAGSEQYLTTTATNNPNNASTDNPVIELNTTGFVSDFGNQMINTNSSERTFTVSGTDLQGDITITAPTGFEVSLETGANFATSKTLSPTGKTVNTSTIFVRFSPTLVQAYGPSNVTNSSTDATTQNVAVQGNGISTPTTQASGILFSNVSRTGMTVSWTNGDADGSLLLAKEQYRISDEPLTDGQVYNGASTVYSSAPTVGGAKMLYNGTDANPSINVTGLTRYKLYYFKAFAYNNVLSPNYLQTDGSNNPRSRWTLRRDALMEEDLSIDAEYPYPNPVSNTITTTLDVFEEGKVSAKIYDIDGKLVSEIYNQALPFGTHELTFDLSNTPSGVYQIVISKGSEAVVYPISVVR